MKAVLIKSLGFIFIVILGYLLKKKGFFKKEDGAFLAKVVMNITLPAALIAGSEGMLIDYVALIIILVGFFSNIFIVFLAKFFNRRSSAYAKAISMINCSGYNIGNFAIPFASSFFPPVALIYMCMFDIGNAFMGLGGTYAIAKNEIDGKGKLDIKNLFKVLLRSVPFDVYLLLFIISLLKIQIPEGITSIASMIGGANGFLAMLMIGIILELNISKKQAKSIFEILFVRYLGNLIISLIVFFLIPIPLLAKQMIILILFAPLSTISAVYSREVEGENPIPALANSISIIIGIVIMTYLLLIFV